MATKNLRIVGVMGGNVTDASLSDPLGIAIAEKQRHLLTGAGGGMMEAVAKAFVGVTNRSGLSLGIVRANDVCRHEVAWAKCNICAPFHMADGDQTNPRRWSYRKAPNRYVEVPIMTHLPDSGARGKEHTSRNHINVLSADVVVALPGDQGTKSEVELALEYRRTLVFFVGAHLIAGMTPRALIDSVPGATATIATSIDQVIPLL